MKNKGIRIISLILVTLMCIGMAACTAPTTPSQTQESAASNTEAGEAPSAYYYTDPEEVIGDANSFEGITIGFSQRSVAGSSWYENLIRIAQAEAEHLGVNLIVTDANGDLATQISDIEDLIAQGCDAIIVNPVDPSGIIAATDMVHQAGIPLINVNSQMESTAAPTCFVGHDTYSFGYSAGTALAEAFDAKNGCPEEIKAAMIMGFPKELYSIQESNGMIAGFTAYYLDKYNKCNLNIVACRYGEWSADTALKETDDILAANADLDILFVLDGSMGVASTSSIQSAGLEGQVMVCCAGGRKEELAAIQEGTIVASATCDPRQEGKWSVLMAAYAASGANVPATMYIDSVGINANNAAELYDPDSAY